MTPFAFMMAIAYTTTARPCASGSQSCCHPLRNSCSTRTSHAAITSLLHITFHGRRHSRARSLARDHSARCTITMTCGLGRCQRRRRGAKQGASIKHKWSSLAACCQPSIVRGQLPIQLIQEQCSVDDAFLVTRDYNFHTVWGVRN